MVYRCGNNPLEREITKAIQVRMQRNLTSVLSGSATVFLVTAEQRLKYNLPELGQTVLTLPGAMKRRPMPSPKENWARG